MTRKQQVILFLLDHSIGDDARLGSYESWADKSKPRKPIWIPKLTKKLSDVKIHYFNQLYQGSVVQRFINLLESESMLDEYVKSFNPLESGMYQIQIPQEFLLFAFNWTNSPVGHRRWSNLDNRWSQILSN
jgi:hypothetical protein